MGERGSTAAGAACGAFGATGSRVRDGGAAAGHACSAFGALHPWEAAAEDISREISPLDKSRSAPASVTGVRSALNAASIALASPPERSATAACSAARAAASPASRGVPSPASLAWLAIANEVPPWMDGVSGAPEPGRAARNASIGMVAGVRGWASQEVLGTCCARQIFSHPRIGSKR